MSGPGSRLAARLPLFDRLADPGRGGPATAALDRAGLLESLLRDLARLLNTRSPVPAHRFCGRELTVIDYGVPDLVALSPLDPEARRLTAAVLEQAVAAFEPRLAEVRATVTGWSEAGGALGLRFEAVLAQGVLRQPFTFRARFCDGEAEVDAGE